MIMRLGSQLHNLNVRLLATRVILEKSNPFHQYPFLPWGTEEEIRCVELHQR